jgi:hypothetical protein
MRRNVRHLFVVEVLDDARHELIDASTILEVV